MWFKGGGEVENPPKMTRQEKLEKKSVEKEEKEGEHQRGVKIGLQNPKVKYL